MEGGIVSCEGGLAFLYSDALLVQHSCFWNNSLELSYAFRMIQTM